MKWLLRLFNTSDKKSKKKFISDFEYTVSPPVEEIVKSFYEKGRWKIDFDYKDKTYVVIDNNNKDFIATDTKTGEKFNFVAKGYSKRYDFIDRFFIENINLLSLPTWLTLSEKCYIEQHFHNINNKFIERLIVLEDRYKNRNKVNSQRFKERERNRLIKIYCEK